MLDRPARDGRAPGDPAELRPPDRRSASPSAQFYVLKDNVALRGNDITNPQQSTDPSPAAPTSRSGSTARARTAFQNVTADDRPARRACVSGARPAAQPALRGRARQPADHGPVRSTTSSTRTGSTATAAPTSPAASRSSSAQDLATELRLGALPINLKLISESQVSATLGKQALHQGLIAGLVGLLVVAIFLIAYYRVLGLIAVAGPGRLRPVLLRADQADPDHADAAGHRRPDPDHRRRRRRQHRHLRARQGGDPRRALDPRRASSPATRRA